MHAFMYVCMFVCICTYIYTHTHDITHISHAQSTNVFMYIHTYIHKATTHISHTQRLAWQPFRTSISTQHTIPKASHPQRNRDIQCNKIAFGTGRRGATAATTATTSGAERRCGGSSRRLGSFLEGRLESDRHDTRSVGGKRPGNWRFLFFVYILMRFFLYILSFWDDALVGYMYCAYAFCFRRWRIWSRFLACVECGCVHARR